MCPSDYIIKDEMTEPDELPYKKRKKGDAADKKENSSFTRVGTNSARLERGSSSTFNFQC